MSETTTAIARQVRTDTQTPTTPDGQPVDVENPRSGSKEKSDVNLDKVRRRHRPSHPPLGARTTFWSSDLDSEEKCRKYNKLHPLQHGRQHPAEPYLDGYSESWDGQKVRQEDVGTYRLGAVLLSRADVDGYWLRRICGKLAQRDLRSFNAHHGGLAGATFGFAMVELYDDAEEAKQSRLAREAQSYDQFDIDSAELADYVFREWEEKL